MRKITKKIVALCLTAFTLFAVGCAASDTQSSSTEETISSSSTSSTVEPETPAQTAKYIMVERNTLALADVDEKIGKAQSAQIDGKDVSFTDNGDGTITFSENVAGERTLIITADTGVYEYQGILADYRIHDYESMKYYFAEARAVVNYAVLTENVKGLYGRESLTCYQYPPEGATLNGLGNTIDSIYFIRGLFGAKKETVANFTLKNITFTRFLAWGWSALAYSLENSTWENVKMEINLDRDARIPYASDGYGLLGYKFSNVTLKSCDIRFSIPTELHSYAIRLFGAESGNSVRLINTKIDSDGFIAMPGERDTGHNAATQAEVFTMDEASSITDERTVVALDSNGHVLLNTETDLALGVGVSVTAVSVGNLLATGGGVVRIAGIAANTQNMLKLTLSDKTERYLYLQVLGPTA